MDGGAVRREVEIDLVIGDQFLVDLYCRLSLIFIIVIDQFDGKSLAAQLFDEDSPFLLTCSSQRR